MFVVETSIVSYICEEVKAFGYLCDDDDNCAKQCLDGQ
jgi:hypothetical protein